MVEPPLGEPDMPSLLAALAALDRDLYCIVEQDMYPCEFDDAAPDRDGAPASTSRRCGLGRRAAALADPG